MLSTVSYHLISYHLITYHLFLYDCPRHTLSSLPPLPLSSLSPIDNGHIIIIYLTSISSISISPQFNLSYTTLHYHILSSSHSTLTYASDTFRSYSTLSSPLNSSPNSSSSSSMPQYEPSHLILSKRLLFLTP